MTVQDLKYQRIAMVVEFDGHAYHGWQRQQHSISIQETLEHALMHIEGHDVDVHAAGRTDAGVHGLALLAHADVDALRWQRSPKAYLHGVNAKLPDDVKVIGVKAVGADFHARFDCVERRYRYQIWNRNTASAIHQWQHWWLPRSLDVAAMQDAATLLLGEHDFSAFRASRCQAASPVKTLHSLQVQQYAAHQISIEVHANAFLYHMVRNLVGSLAQVGLGAWTADDLQQVLLSKDRNKAAATAPAHGLYFIDALYPNWKASDVIGQVLR